MHFQGFLFNVRDYFIGVIYSFTFIDVVKKLLFNELYMTNATNIVQLLATIVALVFGYYRLIAYIRDSRIKSKILEQELIAKERLNFPGSWEKKFIEPFKKEENETE